MASLSRRRVPGALARLRPCAPVKRPPCRPAFSAPPAYPDAEDNRRTARCLGVRQLHQTELMYVGVVATWSASAPPSFVRLAGHPVRWRLLGELSRSNRRVRELVSMVGQPQNLVSYHLGRLRAARLVAARRSTFDARDAYYHLDLANCAEALATAGLALHPGLRLAPVPPG